MIACEKGHKEVALLLADLRINVNQPNHKEATPFFIACQQGHKEVVSLLLNNPRIEINNPENDQCTPLWFASQEGYLSVVQRILASEREVDTKTKSIAGAGGWNNKTTAEIARFQGIRDKIAAESEEDYTRKRQNGPLIAKWIDSFDADPAITRQHLRELPELRDAFISDLFALVVFLCDDFLSVSTESSSSTSPPSSTTSKKAARFFQIAHCLPMELQMVLCNRVFGAGKNSVLTKHSEPAFKRLGRLYGRLDGH